jgi:glycosyltransferase involved in cell wall biosynthesis
VTPINLLIIAHNNLGTSLSGGDQIFLNIIKHAPSNFNITVVGSAETKALLTKYRATPTRFVLSAPTNSISLTTFSLFLHQLIRLFFALKFCFTHPLFFNQFTTIYTASDFPSDSIFGVFSKLLNFKIRWIAGFYLFSPPPFSATSHYNQNHHFFRGILYYLGQLPVYYLVRLLAHTVAVTSDPDTLRFPHKNSLVIQGGVNLPKLTKSLHYPGYIPPPKRRFDALFIGRLHSQKGVLALVDIWQLVTKTNPHALLAIIGDGELKASLAQKIRVGQLDNNIILLGFCIGKKAETIIKNSKIIVHPATFDSGGMAAAQAMAWGLPGVSYDLPALKTYYPQGMLKTPCFNQTAFSENIISLLSDSSLYNRTSHQAITLTKEFWSWPYRLKPLYQIIV